jgi:hypothetical protein
MRDHHINGGISSDFNRYGHMVLKGEFSAHCFNVITKDLDIFIQLYRCSVQMIDHSELAKFLVN